MTLVLFTGGTLWAGPDCVPRAGWLLASGGRVEAVGPPDQPVPGADEVVDLAGGHLLPGFIDSHQHPSLTAWYPSGVDAGGWPDLYTALAQVRAASRRDPLARWLVFWNALPHRWPQRRLPTAGELDAVAPDRRVLICVRDLHRVAVSTVALAELGMDGGRWRAGDVARDRRGRLTGELWEHACGAAVHRVLVEEEQHRGSSTVQAALQLELQRRLGYGYTHVHDAHVPPAQHERMRAVAGMTPLGLSWALGAPEGIFAPGPDPASLPEGRYGAAGAEVKLFLDGGERCALRLPMRALAGLATGAIRDAAAVQGYGQLLEALRRRLRLHHGGVELPYLRYHDQTLTNLVGSYAEAGVRIRIHAVGNLAVAQAARVLRNARVGAGGAVVDHLALLDAGTADALAGCGAWGCFQPGFLTSFAPMVRPNGLHRLVAVFGGRLLHDAGVPLVLSSDHPGGILDPLQILRIAVDRRVSDGTLQPEQGLTQPQTVRALTTAAAACLGVPGAGGLGPGQSANLVVCDGDPFGPRSRVVQTWIAGARVWPAPDGAA